MSAYRPGRRLAAVLLMLFSVLPKPALADGWQHHATTVVQGHDSGASPIGPPPVPLSIGASSRPDNMNEGSLEAKRDLIRAIERAETQNPAIRAALSELDSRRTDIDIARYGYWPEVSVSAGPEEFPFSDPGYNVTARQTLYDWGRTDSEVASARASERSQLSALLIAREESALDVIRTWSAIVTARQQIKATRTWIEQLEALEELTSQRAKTGYADISEGSRVRLDTSEARDQLHRQRGALQEATRQYNILVGDTSDVRPLPAPRLLTEQLGDSDILEEEIRQAPLYQQQIAEVDIARATLDNARASTLPQINLEGTTQRRQIGGRMETDNVIGFRVRMDTLQGLATFRQPDAARQQLEAARWEVDATRRDVERTVATLINDARLYHTRADALLQQFRDARQLSELYREQFSVGARDITDLLNIYRQQANARQQYLEIEGERQLVQYRGAAQLGMLGELLAPATQEPS